MSKEWKAYQAVTEPLATNLVRTLRKREINVMTKNDEVLTETLDKELHEILNEYCRQMDIHLEPLREDPMKLLDMVMSEIKKGAT